MCVKTAEIICVCPVKPKAQFHKRRNPVLVTYILILKIGNIFHWSPSSKLNYPVPLGASPHLSHDQGKKENQGSKSRKEKGRNREIKTF